ncbi:MAG TPA: hypothetical protein VGL88_11765 [Pseudonocardiaceae bacterium]|jgi:hypothetical protein
MTRYNDGRNWGREGSDEEQWCERWPHGLHPAAEFWVGAAQLLHDTALAQVQGVEAAMSRSADDGTPITPELRGAWTVIEARRRAAMDVLGRVKDVAEYGSEHAATTARAAEQNHRDQVRGVYQHLYDPDYYAHIEGDGSQEDAYCDTVYEHAETLVAQGYTAEHLADLDAKARTEESTASAWGPPGMTQTDLLPEASSIDEAPAMTAAQLRGDTAGDQGLTTDTRHVAAYPTSHEWPPVARVESTRGKEITDAQRWELADQWAATDVADDPAADHVEFWETQRAEQAVIRAYWAAQPPVETEQFEATVRAEWVKDPELEAVWDFTDYRQFRLRNVALADRWAAADVADDPAADHVEYWERVADEAAAPELVRGGDPVLAAKTEASMTAQAAATEQWLREERHQLCAEEDYPQEWSVADPVDDRPAPAEFVTGEDPTPEQESYPAPWDASRSGPAVPDSAESPGKARAAEAVAEVHQTVAAELQQATDELPGSRQVNAPAVADNQLDMTSTDCDGVGV